MPRDSQTWPSRLSPVMRCENWSQKSVSHLFSRRSGMCGPPPGPNAPLDDPQLQSLFGILRSADMTYAYMEGPIIDYGAYNGPRVGSSKTFVGELKNMGIRIVTTANNHAMDAGPEGVYMTNRLLDE